MNIQEVPVEIIEQTIEKPIQLGTRLRIQINDEEDYIRHVMGKGFPREVVDDMIVTLTGKQPKPRSHIDRLVELFEEIGYLELISGKRNTEDVINNCKQLICDNAAKIYDKLINEYPYKSKEQIEYFKLVNAMMGIFLEIYYDKESERVGIKFEMPKD